MDLLLLLKALVLGIVEGLTEFLPISSTGHLILVGDLLDFNDERGKLFEIVIQSGAILAVCWEYRAKIGTVLAGLLHQRAAQRFAINIVVAFVPLAGLGLAFGKAIKASLFNAPTVAATFILGGFFILWAERREHRVRVDEVDDLSTLDAPGALDEVRRVLARDAAVPNAGPGRAASARAVEWRGCLRSFRCPTCPLARASARRSKKKPPCR